MRSAAQQKLIVPRCRRNTFGCRAFSVASPSVWNALPDRPRADFRHFKASTEDLLLHVIL